jgi:hypothetical protein
MMYASVRARMLLRAPEIVWVSNLACNCMQLQVADALHQGRVIPGRPLVRKNKSGRYVLNKRAFAATPNPDLAIHAVLGLTDADERSNAIKTAEINAAVRLFQARGMNPLFV